MRAFSSRRVALVQQSGDETEEEDSQQDAHMPQLPSLCGSTPQQLHHPDVQLQQLMPRVHPSTLQCHKEETKDGERVRRHTTQRVHPTSRFRMGGPVRVLPLPVLGSALNLEGLMRHDQRAERTRDRATWILWVLNHSVSFDTGDRGGKASDIMQQLPWGVCHRNQLCTTAMHMITTAQESWTERVLPLVTDVPAGTIRQTPEQNPC
ncbi:unnamed protein product [Pleuronectes platessa]|uniref:Uncharacterized protein n=1 Tax=Pleuronectes platessa TaxID=8262 RepID=A0A9N7UWT3_PLEPL|nr:unnamed protein product [Pleuronectes platessa]